MVDVARVATYLVGLQPENHQNSTKLVLSIGYYFNSKYYLNTI